jgi:hypothetical protein
MLLLIAFHQGDNQLSQDEKAFAEIFESLGRSDMALCVRGGRVVHRISLVLDYGDRPEMCTPQRTSPVTWGTKLRSGSHGI